MNPMRTLLRSPYSFRLGYLRGAEEGARNALAWSSGVPTSISLNSASTKTRSLLRCDIEHRYILMNSVLVALLFYQRLIRFA